VKDTSFTVGLQNIAAEDVEKVVKIIEDTLTSVVEEGFPEDRIAAVLHSYELSLKHR
jgi:Zn-dependent M16 (insulinase) family peptidase